MNDVRSPVEIFEQRECGAREKGETNMVVVVAVDGRAGEEFRNFEQVSRPSGLVAIPEPNLMNLTAPLNSNVLNRPPVEQFAIYLIVERENEPGIDSVIGECFW